LEPLPGNFFVASMPSFAADGDSVCGQFGLRENNSEGSSENSKSDTAI
jgi:hypothetical protein